MVTRADYRTPVSSLISDDVPTFHDVTRPDWVFDPRALARTDEEDISQIDTLDMQLYVDDDPSM